MSVFYGNNYNLTNAYSRYSGSVTAAALAQTQATLATLKNASINGNPVSISGSGNVTFKQSGLYHVTTQLSVTNSNSNPVVAQLLDITNGGSVVLQSRIAISGTYSGDCLIDATHQYGFYFTAASTSAIPCDYDIFIKKVAGV